MNYRHAYHAGNVGDVLKHAVLCRILLHLRAKPAAFRVIDTHAGAGAYNLAGPEATRTGEWQAGIGRLCEATLSPAAAALLAPYREALRRYNPGDRLAVYPGSPALTLELLRPQDRLIACELEPSSAADLTARLRGDARAKAISLDGWIGLNAMVPPKERRGLVLIDPPFERPGEFHRMVQALAAAHRKWPIGSYLLWYPVKDVAETATALRRLARLGIPRMLRVELTAAPEGKGLRGGGLVAVNPPWTLHDELAVLLPELARVLGQDRRGAMRLEWLADDAGGRATSGQSE